MKASILSDKLKDKVAIVTGSSRGIGLEIAIKLAQHGASLVISGRRQESLDLILENDEYSELSITAKVCHVGKTSELEDLVDSAARKFGRIDILVNNAATNPLFSPLEDFSLEAFQKIMDINLKAGFQISNLCFPHLKKSGGSIIHIASVEGIKPSPGLSVYSVSKAALIMLCKSQAKEWGKYGIRSNAICPGLIKTKFSQAIWSNEKFLDDFTSHIPLGRMAEAGELSELALFLASEESSYMTGSVITADGGYLI